MDLRRLVKLVLDLASFAQGLGSGELWSTEPGLLRSQLSRTCFKLGPTFRAGWLAFASPVPISTHSCSSKDVIN